MLRDLTVENLAVIESTRLEFGDGFTALTGETGAGKSLLVDSVDLALGGRADSDLVRHGCSRAVVTLRVDLCGNLAALELCRRSGVDVEDDELVIHREVTAEGRSTVRLNGRAFNVGTLRELGNLLVDVHGQHDHQALLNVERQIEFFDQWARESVGPLRSAVEDCYSTWQERKARLSRLQGNQREREQRIDLLRFQIDEITSSELKDGESEQLANQLVKLKNAEKIIGGVGKAIGLLYEGETSAIDLVRESEKGLTGVLPLDSELAPLAESLASVRVILDELHHDARHYLDSLDADPQLLELATERYELLSKLRRKYGDDDAAVVAYGRAAAQELEELEGGQANLEALEGEVAQAYEAFELACTRLSEARHRDADLFAKEVALHLADLGMEKAIFAVRIERGTPGPNGWDQLEFVFTANSGEPSRSLAKVASGGELSRVMLAIKVASAGRAGVPTLFFDEVDTGLSGKAGAMVGRKLEELARTRQVVVISHLPQVASRATTHYRIDKIESANRVSTTVHHLDGDERVQEIARMLAGEKIGPSAIANAQELLGSTV